MSIQYHMTILFRKILNRNIRNYNRINEYFVILLHFYQLICYVYILGVSDMKFKNRTNNRYAMTHNILLYDGFTYTKKKTKYIHLNMPNIH